ncbi:MAG: hypothetical protein Tsb0021_11470 [Chlamydiales bacterium]
MYIGILFFTVAFFKSPAYYLIAIFICLSSIGLNPYFFPNYFDNIFYYELAKSLMEDNSYTVMEMHVLEWPPFYPMVLALFFSFLDSSILLAKIITLMFAAISLFLIYRICELENRQPAWLILLIMILLPTSISMSVRISTDWPYIALSLAFLLTLKRLRLNRQPMWGLYAGLLLGFACLTRYIGIALFFALLVHVALIAKSTKFSLKKLFPEWICALSAGLLLGAWLTVMSVWKGDDSLIIYQGNLQRSGISVWTAFDPLQLSETILDLFLQWNNLSNILGIGEFFSKTLVLIPMLILAYGAFEHFKPKNVTPSDVYTFVVFLLFLFYEWKASRFILCIAPFLLSYLFTGMHKIRLHFPILKAKQCNIMGVFILVIWGIYLLALDLHLLFLGNRKDHSGLSLLVSPTLHDFYLGKWKDYALIIENLKSKNIAASTEIGIDGTPSYNWIYFYGLTGYKVKQGVEGNFLIVDPDWMEKNTYDSYIPILNTKHATLLKKKDLRDE